MGKSQLSLAVLTAALLATNVGIADARRQRRPPPPVEEPTPDPRCFDQESQQWINCITNQPIADQPETSSPGVIVESTTETTLTPSADPIPLDLRHHTIEQFNDSRVAELHQRVGVLIQDAVDKAARPFVAGRNPSLVNEIQARLDPLADGADPNRPIDYYWMIYFPDRTVVFVKPMRNLHVLRYTILVGN